MASDLDNLDEGDAKVSLMTLHSAKGLEFPIVFLVGVEQGLLPHSRTVNDPLQLEEERRLCYVGITRAQEQLFLTYTRERRLWGYREPAVASQFLTELPEDLINSNIPYSSYSRRRDREEERSISNNNLDWAVGDRVFHKEFGEGEVTHVLNSGTKPTLGIKFAGIKRTKILSQNSEMEKIE